MSSWHTYSPLDPQSVGGHSCAGSPVWSVTR